LLGTCWRKPGARDVEASSGSTSIALALACAQLGVSFTAVMPEGVTEERVLTIEAYGGRVIFVSRDEGMRGAIVRAELEAKQVNAFVTRQFENPGNAEAHRAGTGREILAQIPGGIVDGVVSGIGTGGTIVGLYQAFINAGCNVTPFVARPVIGSRPSDVQCCSFSSRVPGVVEGLSKICDRRTLPGRIELDVHDEVALATAHKLIGCGYPVGPSSGLNYAAAVMAARHLGPAAHVVTVFPDRMEHYFSTDLFPKLPK
jgi:cysteine synthase A